MTGGYSWANTSTSSSNKLIRDEHRTWGQLFGKFQITKTINYQVRLRYDARFRQSIVNKLVTDNRLLYNRLRLMNSIKFPLKEYKNHDKLSFTIQDEFLVNFGKHATKWIDQNRF